MLFDLRRSYLGCEGMMENTSIVQQKQQVVQELMVSSTALRERQLVVEGITWLCAVQDMIFFFLPLILKYLVRIVKLLSSLTRCGRHAIMKKTVIKYKNINFVVFAYFVKEIVAGPQNWIEEVCSLQFHLSQICYDVENSFL